VAEYKRRHGMTDEQHDEWMEKSIAVMMEVLSVSKENIFLKLRQRKPGRLGQYQKYDEVQHEFEVEENQLKFIVNLSDYLDTGLFLDHRITRQMVREQSTGKKVLNLFAYTGSFSVYAAAGLPSEASSGAIGYGRRLSPKEGGANEVVTVDLSNTYLKWAEKNMQLNGFNDRSKYQFIQADVKQYLKTIPPGHFDIIIMDPPTFSNSKRMEDFLDIQRDHVELINDCLKGLKTGGMLFFSTNSGKFILEQDKIKASSVKDITKATTPFDFVGKIFRWCYKIEK
jgi:23S rRNA (cytosine1962-C5)-methyltransferase